MSLKLSATQPLRALYGRQRLASRVPLGTTFQIIVNVTMVAFARSMREFETRAHIAG